MGKRAPIDQQKWWKKMKDHPYIRLSLFIGLGIVMYILMVSNIIPENLNVSLGSFAERDIRSPITIENRAATEAKKAQAAEMVDPQYSSKKHYAENQVEKTNKIFDSIIQVKNEAEEENERRKEEYEQEILRLEQDDVQEEITEIELEIEMEIEEVSLEEKLASLRSIISARTNEDLSDETLLTFLQTDKQDLEIAREVTTNAIYSIMSEEIRINEVGEARDNVRDKLVISTIGPKLYNAMLETARFAIIANYIYDEELTEQVRNTAIESVEPVMIREGQLLVEQGERVTAEALDQLALVGLLDNDTVVYPYIGLGILVLLLVSMIGFYTTEAKTTLQHNNSHLLMYVLILSVTIIVMKLTSLVYNVELYGITLIVPVAVGSMLITMLIHRRVALFTSMIISICASIIFNSESTGMINYTLAIYVFFSSVAGVFFLSKSNRVTRILQAGLFVSAVNILTIMALLMIRNGQYSWVEISYNLTFAFFSGFLAAVLTLGLLPFFEAGFGILSTIKLIELSSPNHPLLRKILVETPGTYHHSVIVANLAEAACESVGANGLLARVGSYYHDLGKTKRPHFFIENQMKLDNPHDKISPQLSKTIIVAHPYDGAEMLRSHKMPKEIIDIAEQHHGTSLLKFFYHKASQESDQPIPKEEFRYPGPKAQSIESAIVGIADCVEAAVRSMARPTPEKIEALVKKIITDRLEDGQFDECDVTLKQLNQVAQSICETLKGTFHSRIEYPDDASVKGDNKE